MKTHKNIADVRLLPVTLNINKVNGDEINTTTKLLYIDGVSNSVSTGKLIGYVECCEDNDCIVEVTSFDQRYQPVDDLLMKWLIDKMPAPEVIPFEAEVQI